MSSDIWTQSAARSEISSLSAVPWRVVEAQHRIATRKLVGSDAEQFVLEQLLEQAKPPGIADARLHYLLSTPFRYPSLPGGSRFGAPWMTGIWYGSETRQTAFAEVAYYRFVFLEGTAADLGAVETDLTAFRTGIRTPRGIDLTASVFRRYERALTSRTSYTATQQIGAEMRAAGVEAFRSISARDPARGTNIGVFTPRAFTARRPQALETWRAVATRAAVEISKRDYFARSHVRFERRSFLVNGHLPMPALRQTRAASPKQWLTDIKPLGGRNGANQK